MAPSYQKHAGYGHMQSVGCVDALKVRRLLDALPVEQREAIELASYDGLTCREIAARLREPVSTIKMRLRVGLFELSEQLSHDADDVGVESHYLVPGKVSKSRIT
jgi:hypothetical protein